MIPMRDKWTMIIRCLYDVMMPIKDLKARFNPANTNDHSADQIDRLSKILKYQGARYPAKISKRSDLITSGHGRVLAAEKAGWDQYPVNFQDYDDETQENADLTADNAIASWAVLDLSKVNKQIQDMGPDFDIELLGIKDFEIDIADRLGADEDETGNIPIVPRSKRGDLYVLGNHVVLCGDSTDRDDIDRLMSGERADMVFTDPPYGVSYEAKTKGIANQRKISLPILNDDLSVEELKPIIQAAFNNIEYILADKSCYYIASPQGGELGLMMMMMMQEAGIPCRHIIVWVKNAPVFSMGRLDYDYQHEPLLYGWPEKKSHHKSHMKGQWTKSVWDCDREPNKLHPTMKPVALIENALLNSTDRRMLCADLFGGSGSTLIACEKTERRARLMEIDPQYVDVIVDRWCAFTKRTDVIKNGDAIEWQKAATTSAQEKA